MSQSFQSQQQPHPVTLQVESSPPLQPHPRHYRTGGEVFPHIPRANSEPTITEPSHMRPYVQSQPRYYHTGLYTTRAGSDPIIIEARQGYEPSTRSLRSASRTSIRSEPTTRELHARFGSESPIGASESFFREPYCASEYPRESRRARVENEPYHARLGSESPIREPYARLENESSLDPYHARMEVPIREPHHRSARGEGIYSHPRNTSQLSDHREGHLQ